MIRTNKDYKLEEENKKLIFMRNSPRTFFETNFLQSYVELFKSFQMMYYMTLFGICVNEKKDI